MPYFPAAILPRPVLCAVAGAFCTVSLGLLTPTAALAQGARAETVAGNLQNPWAVAFLPEGKFLVTERPGRMRIVESDGKLGAALTGLPAIAAGGQGGLLDVVADSDFAANRTVFFCFSEPGAGGNSTALARAQLSADSSRLDGVRVIFSQKPKVASNGHFGCRIVEGRQPGVNGKPDGNLFLTLGERYQRKDDAQTFDNHHGKVVRIGKDGSVPKDNPFNTANPNVSAIASAISRTAARAGALPEIWSYGHRNMQGATLSPEGVLWTHEHGPQGGDEINLPQAGRNYGWPVITYGENYGGGKIGDGLTAQSGMEQPLHYWVPSIAPSGMAFLTSERYGKAWVGNLFVGSLKFGYLNRIELSEPFKGKVVKEHKLMDLGRERIRDIRQGPDGLLYGVTDSANGRLFRLLPP